MSQDVLTAVLFCICNKFAMHDARQVCVDQYVNCAVGHNGSILNKKDLVEKCDKKLYNLAESCLK